MKKIYSICLAIALGGLTLASCSNNDYTEKTSSVQIIEGETNMPVSGGSKTLLVTEGKVEEVSTVRNIYDYRGEQSEEAKAETVLTASAADEWLDVKVDGSLITITADANDGIQTRHTLVTITGASGDKTIVNVSQAGLITVIEAEQTYIFNSEDNEDVTFGNLSNVEFEEIVSDEWIHLQKDAEGYTINVDENTGEYRRGTITLKYKNLVEKTIYIGQWGQEMPALTSLNTAIYQDEEGNTYTKPVTITESAVRTWLIKGLVDEGDVKFQLSNQAGATKQQYFIPAGYSPGKKLEDGTNYTLRCIMSAYYASNGTRYYPTASSTLATNAYRMALDWQIDEEANPTFAYVRNSKLGVSESSYLPDTYTTDGILVCKYNGTSAADSYRKGIVYTFLKLRLIKQ